MLIVAALAVFMCCGCAEETLESTRSEDVLATYAANGPDGLVAGSAAAFDPSVSSDGGGSLKVAVMESATVALYETGDIDIEAAMLVYRAKLRCENLDGRAFLEMLCSFAEKGEYFSRGMDSAVGGTVDWTPTETPFFLQAGQNPTNVQLNLVVEGTGTVWIDEIEVLKAALP